MNGSRPHLDYMRLFKEILTGHQPLHYKREMSGTQMILVEKNWDPSHSCMEQSNLLWQAMGQM